MRDILGDYFDHPRGWLLVGAGYIPGVDSDVREARTWDSSSISRLEGASKEASLGWQDAKHAWTSREMCLT